MQLQVQLAQRLATAGDQEPQACNWTAYEHPSNLWLEFVPGSDQLLEANSLAAGCYNPLRPLFLHIMRALLVPATSECCTCCSIPCQAHDLARRLRTSMSDGPAVYKLNI